MNEHSELKRLAEDVDEAKCADESEYGRRLAAFYEEVTPEAVLELFAEIATLRMDADRYQVLRQADIHAVHDGGLFAGLTPDNVVINGVHLDQHIDALIAVRRESQP